ncbi:unnamed protein product [Parnassius apollo]|uniref:Regulatory protein zeste n=1 Tax=Parnassius apollo TaxID=110799 RepID=A0A8S3WCP0_PARAO|nr:unnamed protein product [Parnassius apollo]
MEPKTPYSRVPNFTSDEKALLAALIMSKPIVESKATDGKSVDSKKTAWESITQEFNCQAYVYKRDTVNLKRAWDNMKAFTRKARAAERGSLFKTGGGPVKPTLPPHQGAIISMVEEVAPVIICEVKNSFDSDGCLLSSLEEDELATQEIKQQAAELELQTNKILLEKATLELKF